MMNDEKELLPCPFCGGPAVKEHPGKEIWGPNPETLIACSKCSASIFAYSEEDAVRQWNQRVGEDDG